MAKQITEYWIEPRDADYDVIDLVFVTAKRFLDEELAQCELDFPDAKRFTVSKVVRRYADDGALVSETIEDTGIIRPEGAS